MANNIVQLQDNSGNNIYPIAGGTTQGVITKAMMADDAAFIDGTIGTVSNDAYVGTNNIQDGAVTEAKLGAQCPIVTDILSAPSDVAYVATANIQDGAVTPSKLSNSALENGAPVTLGTITIGNNTYTHKMLYYEDTVTSASQNFTIAELYNKKVISVTGVLANAGSLNDSIPFGYCDLSVDYYISAFVRPGSSILCYRGSSTFTSGTIRVLIEYYE